MAEDELTLRDIYNYLDHRLNRLEDSMDKLVETTNHHLERFEDALGKKATTVDLLPTVASQILHSKTFWAITTVLFAVMAPVIIDHWHLLIDRIFI